MPNIVMVENEEIYRMRFKSACEKAGHSVWAFSDPEEMYLFLNNHACDLIVSDYMLDKVTGQDVLEHVRTITLHKKTRFLMISATNDLLKLAEIGDKHTFVHDKVYSSRSVQAIVKDAILGIRE